MNKRGFTLIELLTVIVLLAVISIISFVSINAVIEKNHVNDCMSLRESIKSATLDYFSDHRYDENLTLAGFNAGILVNAKYLSSPIYNPFDRSIEITPSDILIDITIDNRYNATSVDIVSPDLLVTCTKTTSGSTGVADGLDVHQIDFNATTNGGRLNGTSPLYVKNGDSKFYTSPYATNQGSVPSATKSDLVFSGWYTKNKGGDRVIRSNGVIVPSISGYTNNSGKWQLNSNKVLYAQFYPRTYTVNFYQGNGTSSSGSSLIGTQTCNFDQDCTLNTYASFNKVFPYSSSDTANSYSWHFAGWTENEKSTQVKYNESTNNKINPANYSATVNLYAIGYRDNYFYYYDTATNTAKRTIVKQYWNPYSTADAYRTEITIPAKHDMNSWTFKGYKLANSAATEAVANNLTYDVTKIGTKVKPALNNKGYYRSFYSRELSVKYNANGGSGAMNPTTITQYFNSGIGDTANNEPKISSNDITLSANEFNRAGYTFINWTENSATGDEYAAGSTYSKIGTNVTDTSVETTMYAKWTQNVVKITIKKDDTNWSSSGMSVWLYKNNQKVNIDATYEGTSATFKGVPTGTYDVYASFSDGQEGKTIPCKSGTSVTVSGLSTTGTINYYTITKSVGANTTLKVQYESSSGTEWTTNSHAFLTEAKLYIVASGNAGYNVTLNVVGTNRTSPYTLTVSKAGQISTTATGRTYTINYNQGNGTSTKGSSPFEIVTSCTFGSACKLATYATLGGTFPEASRGWTFYGWSTSQTGMTRTYTDGQSINLTSYTETLNLYAVGKRDVKFAKGIAPTSWYATKEQFWNPYSTDYATTVAIPSASELGNIGNGWSFRCFRSNNEVTSTCGIAQANHGKDFKIPVGNSVSYRSIYERTVTLEYNINGGTGTVPTSQTDTQYYNSGIPGNSGNSGENISKLTFALATTSLTKSGYAFGGWGTSASATSGTAAGGTTTFQPAVDTSVTTKTVYAVWTPNVVTITVKKDGSNWSSSGIRVELYKNGSVVYSSSSAKADGATYSWSAVKADTYDLYASYNNGSIGKTMMRDTGVNVKVNSTSTTATINYYEITRSAGTNTTLKTQYENSVGEPWTSTPLYFLSGTTAYITATASDGYDLKLNVLGTERTSPYTLTISGKGAISTTAQAKTYTINYSCGSGTGTAPKSQQVVYNTSFTIANSAGNCSRVGYVFNGWYSVGQNGTGESSNWVGTWTWTYLDGKYGITNRTLSLTAKWILDPNMRYVVKHYVRDLGANTYTLNSTENKTGETNSTVTLENLKKTIAGFTYDGGYTSGNTTRPSSGAVTTTTILGDGTRVINLYYRRNYLYVKYHVNGGSLSSSHGDGYGISGSLITYDGSDSFKRGVYGGKVGYINDTTLEASSGLHNYNNSSVINITRGGYTTTDGAEWNTAANGKGTSYDHDVTTYDANGFGGQDLSTGDKTVTLYVNWIPKPVRIYYHPNGGTVSSDKGYTTYSGWISQDGTSKFYEEIKGGGADDLYNYGTFGISKSEYTPSIDEMWCTDAAGTANCHNQTDDFTYDHYKAIATEETSYYKLNFYLHWIRKPIRIYYLPNGGTVTSDKYTTYNNYVSEDGETAFYQLVNDGGNVDLYNYNNTFGIIKSGEIPLSTSVWCTNTSGTANCHDQTTKNNYEHYKAIATEKTTYYRINFYLHWTPKPVWIYYHPNTGTIDSDTYTILDDWIAKVNGTAAYHSTINSGENFDLVNYVTFGLKKANYIGVDDKEWCKNANGTGTCYDYTAKKDYDGWKAEATEESNHYEIRVYANWAYDATPTITRSDYNTFTYSATGGAAYYVSNTKTAAPSAGSSAAATTAKLDGWTTSTTSPDITAAGTYYVWVKNAKTGGQVSAKPATITAYTITRSQGTGTTLTTRYDSTSSTTGTAFTSKTVMLSGTSVWAKATIDSGYNGTATLKHGDTAITASGGKFTVDASEVISSGGATLPDTTPPTISVSLKVNGNNYNGGWTNQNVVATVTFSDSGSGINPSTLQWKATGTNASGWQTVNPANTSTTTYANDSWSAERSGTGYYKICDYSNNCAETSFTIRIDKTAPTASMWLSDAGQGVGTKVVVECTDNASGLSSSKSSYKFNGSAYELSDGGSSLTGRATSTVGGAQTATLYCQDNAGNGKTVSNTYTFYWYGKQCYYNEYPAEIVIDIEYQSKSETTCNQMCGWPCVNNGYGTWSCEVYNCSEGSQTGPGAHVLVDGYRCVYKEEKDISSSNASCPTSQYTYCNSNSINTKKKYYCSS